MESSCLRLLALALLAAMSAVFAPRASARPSEPVQAKPQTRQIRGQIVQMASDQFVVKTSTKKQITVHTRPQTRFLLKDKAVQLSDLRVGAEVTVNAVLEADRPFAESVVIAEPAAIPAGEPLIEGEIVRVIGKDQIVVRTPQRKEVIVFVEPRTKFLIDEKAAVFTDLRVGHNVRVNANVHDGRNMARQVVVPPRRK